MDLQPSLFDSRLQLLALLPRCFDLLEQLSVLLDLRLSLPVKGPAKAEQIEREQHGQRGGDAQSAKASSAYDLRNDRHCCEDRAGAWAGEGWSQIISSRSQGISLMT